MTEKSFMELVSSDDKVKIEVLTAGYKALAELAEAKGFKAEAIKANREAVDKVAEAHGYKHDEISEINEDQLKAVAGGVTQEPNPRDTPENGEICFFMWGTGGASCMDVIGW